MAQTTAVAAPRPRALQVLLFASVLLAAGAAAAPYPNLTAPVKEIPAKAEWYQQCLRVRTLRPPVGDLPGRGSIERCNATELYYDTQNMAAPTDADWNQVRECAFRTNNSGVLMMLYANGIGVAASPGLAVRYACSTESSVTEMKGRLAHLRSKTAGENFDLCDDVTGGTTMGFCASVRERQREKLRSAQFAAMTKAWSAREQLGFEMASKAAHYFAQQRFEHETDLGGPARGAMQVEAIAAERDRFSTDIEDFERGKTPQFTEAEFKALEDKMNEVYDRFMQGRAGPGSYLGTIRKSGVERTQRAWLAYRDAMELFGSIKYPSVPASGWRALLTSRRLKQLSELDDALAGR